MPRRRRLADRYSGSLLDAPPGVDADAWSTNNLLTPVKRETASNLCSCPPASANRLGGCRPMVRLVDDGQLSAICSTCMKAIVRGVHRRRDQTHVLGLVEIGANNLDLKDLEAAGLLFKGDQPQSS